MCLNQFVELKKWLKKEEQFIFILVKAAGKPQTLWDWRCVV
jgi:hypothetical protein